MMKVDEVEMYSDDSEELSYKEAEKRVRKIKKFYKDLAGFAGTSFFLLAFDFFLSGSITWSKYPVFFYGIFVLADVFNVIRLQRLDKTWEERQIRRFTNAPKPQPIPQQVLHENSERPIADYSDELLRREDQEFPDLKEFRKVNRPWKEEDLV